MNKHNTVAAHHRQVNKRKVILEKCLVLLEFENLDE